VGEKVYQRRGYLYLNVATLVSHEILNVWKSKRPPGREGRKELKGVTPSCVEGRKRKSHKRVMKQQLLQLCRLHAHDRKSRNRQLRQKVTKGAVIKQKVTLNCQLRQKVTKGAVMNEQIFAPLLHKY
jgi:hypothetical protein